MRNMKVKLYNFTEKFANVIGEASIKISDKAIDMCYLPFLYEPEISVELLEEKLKE